MLDIGQVHRNEYDLQDRTIPVVAAEAPGRVLFLGGQGEPEYDFLLSAAIDRLVHVAVSPRKDNSFRFFAADVKERKRCSLTNLKYKREDRWANYLKTAVFMFTGLGHSIKGLSFSFCGNIPQQIGLASSTAIEIAAAIALKNLLRIQMPDADLAVRLCEAHKDFFGKPASLADYQISLMARKDHFLILDSSAGVIQKIKSPLSGFRLLLVDSRVPRLGIESELASRKADTIKGFELLVRKHGGGSLKDFSSDDLLDALGNFPEQLRRRAVHIVEEMHRVKGAGDALQRGDINSLAKIIFHSHESLRDLYEISCPEIDWLVKRAQELENTAGSRMTGDGFGGCTYAIVRREMVNEYKNRLEEYERIFGFRPAIYEIKIATGARLLPK